MDARNLASLLKTSRQDAFDEITNFIRSDLVTSPDGMISMRADDLLDMIRELLPPST